ncbi:MAG TPA: transcription antitermination factor NusB [Cyclobacteriaceae bacterium]
MLNRRMLRIKAMQALYGLQQSLDSDYQLGYAALDHKLSEMPGDENPDIKKKALEEYTNTIRGYKESASENLSSEISSTIDAAVNDYREIFEREKRHFNTHMNKELDSIHKNFLSFLHFPAVLANYEKSKTRSSSNFQQNKGIYLIENLLKNKTNSFSIKWENHREITKSIFRVMVDDAEFVNYQSKKSSDEKKDIEILEHLFKKEMFKNEALNDYMHQKDLYWSENAFILKSLIRKMFKNYVPDANEKERLTLPTLLINEEEDLQFLKDLFHNTIKNDNLYEKLIAQKAQNWDINRIAYTDKILLKMGITELIHFPSIPVKVTINEYIELSKNYSTPKSKQFVNGILDVLSKELKNKGLVKKSGRGLIDNK